MTEVAPEYLGHRARLKQRFLEGGGVGLAEYELLELALTYAIPRRDVKPLAKRLLVRFGGLNGVLNANHQELMSVDGMGESTAIFTKLMGAMAKKVAKSQIGGKPLLDNRVGLLDYLYTRFADNTREELVALFVDTKLFLLGTETLFTGTLDATVAAPRELIKRALDHNAAGMIVAHNHPSGAPSPSEADVVFTKKLDEVCAALGITLFDHVIVGAEEHYSFKGHGLI